MPASPSAWLKAARLLFSGSGGRNRISDTPSGEWDRSHFWTWGWKGAKQSWGVKAGDLTLSAPVNACLQWYARAWPTSTLQVVTKGDAGDQKPVKGHPLTALLERPNPHWSGDALWQYANASLWLTGNAYWYRARGNGGMGATKELWPLPPATMKPLWPASGAEYLIGYEYQVDAKQPVFYRPDEIVHLRLNHDPVTRQGRAPLQAVLREICSENEASAFSEHILANMGCPSVLISPKAEGSIQDSEAFRKLWQKRTTGDQRGMPLVQETVAIELQKLTFTPEELALDKIRTYPQDYICSAFGVNPMVVGLTSGAAHKTFANYEEANEAAYRMGLMPLQRLAASELQLQLLPELGNPATETVQWDYTLVPELQEDEDARWTRWLSALEKGAVSVNEFRAAVGLATAAADFDTIQIQRREEREDEQRSEDTGAQQNEGRGNARA
jgi:HK97 family phage portal protein